MVLGSDRRAGIGARSVVVGLGVAYVVLGAALAARELRQGRPQLNVLVVALYVVAPGTVLAYGGLRLPATGIRRGFYGTVARWSLAGLTLMAASLALYQIEPAESISDPVRATLVLTAFGALAGFGVGSREALAQTRAQILEERNEELQRTETELAETVERLEAANRELEASNERLDQFANVVSHDLKEPLRMVTSYLSLLEDRYGGALDDEAGEYLEFAVDGAERMRGMVDGLLELSRVETRGAPLEPVDLDDVLRDVQRDLQLQIEETDAMVEVDQLPTVRGDEEQLRQLFQNLVSNALQYSGEEAPHVTVTADPGLAADAAGSADASPEATDESTTVSVRDRGIGMDPDDAERIFEVFQRLHTREEYEGTGIGLALCKRIVERHGGTIDVDSTPGEGSTFSVTLPAAAARVEA